MRTSQKRADSSETDSDGAPEDAVATGAPFSPDASPPCPLAEDEFRESKNPPIMVRTVPVALRDELEPCFPWGEGDSDGSRSEICGLLAMAGLNFSRPIRLCRVLTLAWSLDRGGGVGELSPINTPTETAWALSAFCSPRRRFVDVHGRRQKQRKVNGVALRSVCGGGLDKQNEGGQNDHWSNETRIRPNSSRAKGRGT